MTCESHREVTAHGRIAFHFPNVGFKSLFQLRIVVKRGYDLQDIQGPIFNNKVMKKAVLFLCILGANMAFVSCTDDSLADINEFNGTYANDPGSGGSTGEDGQIIPPPDKPGS